MIAWRSKARLAFVNATLAKRPRAPSERSVATSCACRVVRVYLSAHALATATLLWNAVAFGLPQHGHPGGQRAAQMSVCVDVWMCRCVDVWMCGRGRM